MLKIEIMNELLKENNGYFFVADAVKKGISKTYIENYVKEKNLEKVSKGIYISDNAWEDFHYIIHKKYSKAVFSHETALDIHGLLDRKYGNTTVTVNRSYNATNLRKTGCIVYTISPELHGVGVVEANTFWGNKVLVYDMDRTICDIIKHKDKIPLQSYQFAIKEYMKSSKKNLQNLTKYAKLLKIEKTVNNYMEILL